MKQQTSTNIFKGVVAAFVVMAMAVPAFPNPYTDFAQQNRNRSGGGQARGGGGQQGGNQAHARREVVRTNNFVQRSGPSNFTRTPAPPRNPQPNFQQQPQQNQPRNFQPQQNQPRTQPQQQNPPRNYQPQQQNQPRNYQPQQNPRNSQTQPGRPQTFQNQPGRNDSRVGPTTTRHFGVQNAPNRTTERRFTAGPSSRRYDNGLQLHSGTRVTAGWQRHYFPQGYAHFAHYEPSFRAGVFVSPFGFFFGECDPYISASVCNVYPPSVMYVDVPEYNGTTAIGYPPDESDNIINDPNLDSNEPGLTNAMDELSEAFQNGDIDAMATLVSPNVSIAVYEQGHYKYSMSADNYMDLTRDALQSTHPVSFNITDVRQRSANVFSVSGEQTYTDPNGNTRGVYMSFVLQDYGGQWTLSQVGTAPDRVQGF